MVHCRDVHANPHMSDHMDALQALGIVPTSQAATTFSSWQRSIRLNHMENLTTQDYGRDCHTLSLLRLSTKTRRSGLPNS